MIVEAEMKDVCSRVPGYCAALSVMTACQRDSTSYIELRRDTVKLGATIGAADPTEPELGVFS